MEVMPLLRSSHSHRGRGAHPSAMPSRPLGAATKGLPGSCARRPWRPAVVHGDKTALFPGGSHPRCRHCGPSRGARACRVYPLHIYTHGCHYLEGSAPAVFIARSTQGCPARDCIIAVSYATFALVYDSGARLLQCRSQRPCEAALL